MSDKPGQNSEDASVKDAEPQAVRDPVEDAADAATEHSAKPEPQVQQSAKPEPQPEHAQAYAQQPPPQQVVAPVVAAPRAGGVVTVVVAWLALLMVLALGAAAFWFFQQQTWRAQDVSAKLDKLSGAQQLFTESRLKREEMLNSQEQRLRALLREEVSLAEGRITERQQQVLDRVDRQASEQRQAIATEIAQKQQAASVAIEKQREQVAEVLDQQRQAVTDAINTQREELARFNVSDRQQWLVAETQYLLRLANQRIMMAGDVEAARALLVSADEIARQLESIDYLPLRSAVADDLAALRSVRNIDKEGLYLRLSALIHQIDRLKAFEMPKPPQLEKKEKADTLKERLQQGYDAALAKVSRYVQVRRRDVPYTALMDPQWEGLVRQNLRMLLEQAQMALLMGNQALYEDSLKRAGHWVVEFFDADKQAATAMAEGITALQGETVSVELPDVSGSLRALNEVIAKHQQEG